MRNEEGFTLIEVILAVSILAVLAMFAAQSIQQGIKAKSRVQNQIDDISRLRDALRIMERDINLAYHDRDFESELKALVKKSGQPAEGAPPAGAPEGDEAAATQTDSQEPPPEAPRQDPTTHFVGAENTLSFVTMNNARMVRNSRQADFIEVGYSVKDCKSADGARSSRCLWRRTSNVVDRDVLLGGDEVVLLEDVTEFKLQYIGQGKQDWGSLWRTDQGGDGATKGRFPQAVEITLGVSKGPEGRKKSYKLTIVASVHFPNNKEVQPSATP